LVTIIIILASIGGGLAGKFIQQDKNSGQGSISSPGTSRVNSSTLATQLTGRTAWTEFSFVTQVSSAGGSAIYSTVTTSEPIILTNQNSANSVTNTIAATTNITVPPIQGNWRYCQNCHSMFYNGFSAAGVCVGGGGHVAAGFNFDLPHDIPPTVSTQEQWRYCKNCFVMFFNGDTDKGTCATGGGHVADGYVFVLPHDITSTTSNQDQWRYCNKCHTLFYDGYSDKGLCALGGGHVADGFNFVLPHDLLST
jgi:RNase P subunit RPR2